MEIRKKATFLQVINNPIIYKFFKDFTNLKKRPTGWQFLTVDLSSTFLNTGTTNEIFQQSGKQDSSRHILKSSASMYESSGSQFFRSTTGVQSGPDVFDESTFVKTFLTILELWKYQAVSDQFQMGKQVKRYPSHQVQTSKKSFQQTIMLYQMQKTMPQGR